MPTQDSARLLSDRGLRYLANGFEVCLQILSLRHILCLQHHSQTNGRLDCILKMLRPLVTAPIELDYRGLQPGLPCCDGCTTRI